MIDTDIWIAIERGRLSAADIHAVTRQAPIHLLPVNLAEIRFGIDLMADAKQKNFTDLQSPPDQFQIIPAKLHQQWLLRQFEPIVLRERIDVDS